MIYYNIQHSGSLNVSGSFTVNGNDLSNGAVSASIATIAERVQAGTTGSRDLITAQSGSLWFNTNTSNLEVYVGVSGSEWQVVGAQTSSVPEVVLPSIVNIEYLLVAGGGSGGSNSAGGGGAGGLLSSSLSSVTSGSSFTVTIGAGASGVAYNSDGLQGVDSTISGTSITTVTAIGGGGGHRFDNDETDGGSGGGGGVIAGQGTLNQGNDGGVLSSDGATYTTGGGGGGALAAGGDATPSQGGSGGNGKTSNITGTSTTYAGGGGGAGDSRSSRVGGTGGSGGGGNGGYNGGNGLTAGGANTGGGSGGNGYSSGASLSGGSGVAIFAYSTGSTSSRLSGGIRRFTSDGRVAHIFNESDTLTVGGTKTFTHTTLNIFNDNSCVALYNLDGNANDTGGNYNGTASNVSYAQSYINDGAVFNGINSAIVNTSFGISGNQARSYSAWVYTNGSTSGTICGVGNHGTAGQSMYFWIDQTNGGRWSLWGYTATYDLENQALSAIANLSNGWHHFVLTWDANQTFNVYIDGSLADTKTKAVTYNTPAEFAIGRWYDTGYWFNSKIDQVRIFNKKLSTSEVTTLYTE